MCTSTPGCNCSSQWVDHLRDSGLSAQVPAYPEFLRERLPNARGLVMPTMPVGAEARKRDGEA